MSALPERLRLDIEQGQSRTLCPACQGGRSGEISLGLTPERSGIRMVYASCWRASCGYRAVIVLDPNATYTPKPKQGSPYTKPLVLAHKYAPLRELLLDRYNIHAGTYAGRWFANETGELVMEVRGPNGLTRGHQLRNFPTVGEAKQVRAFKPSAQPWLDWWQPDYSKPIVLVEDQLSAARVAQVGYNAVALLGTKIDGDRVAEISRDLRGRKVIFAYDGDAFDKALDASKKYSHLLPDRAVLYLVTDLKDLPKDGTIKELLDSV